MDQMGSQNGMDELEIIDSDSRKVAVMLGALPRVEAPADFEFRVKAGIANGAPSRALLPFLKTAAPFALIAIVVSFGLLYYQGPSGTELAPLNDVSMSGPSVAPPQADPAPAIGGAPESSTVTNPTRETVSTRPERVPAGSRRASSTQRTVSSSSGNRAQGGSVDRIIHPANVIMPPGFESANPQNRNANTGTTSETSVREVLGILGIEGDFANGGWKVRSVKENSVGYGAKIVAGDVIESIDGQPVRNDAKIKGSAKTFTVRRDGKVITLSSGN